jgi:outer membrane protein assembly factor BamD
MMRGFMTLVRWAGWNVALLGTLLTGCGGKARPIATASPKPEGVSRATLDSLWARALHEYTGGHWGKAVPLFERMTLEVPPGDSLAIEAHFRLAECYLGQGTQLQAAREFRKVSDDFPTSRLAPVALLRAGDSYRELWRRPELDPTYGQTALSTYQELLNRYPDSPVAARARLRIEELNEWFAAKEYKSAEYYYRLKAYDSAILYLKDLAATYPRAPITPEALLKLVDAYRAVGYAEDQQETCGYIRRYHPRTPGLDDRCPLPQDTTAATPPASR